jgi:sodium-independent sulfate anion transporter 11
MIAPFLLTNRSLYSNRFFYIPDAALSAVIMVAVATLVSPPSVFYQFFKVDLWDFLASQVALWVTIFVSVETGIASGVGFSLVVLLVKIARPNFRILRQVKDRPTVFVDEGSSFDTVSAPHGILVFRIEESTVFPNTESFKTWAIEEAYKYTRFGGRVKASSERLWSDDLEHHIYNLRKIAHGPDSNITDNDLPKLRAVILDFSAINNVDFTGLQGLFDLKEMLKDYAGVNDFPDTFFEVHYANVQSNVLQTLELSGITKADGSGALNDVHVVDDGKAVAKSEETEHSNDNKESQSTESYLGEGGLVHLTVRDAIDAVLARAGNTQLQRQISSSDDDDETRSVNNKKEDKSEIQYV